MKKGALFLSILLIFWAVQNRSAHRLYLKEETMLRHLKKEPFLTKEPAFWMVEQIEEDFQNVKDLSKKAVDAAFDQVKRFSPMVVRYRIVGNKLYRYFVEDEPISLTDNSTEKAFKTLLQRIRFPDMDFIVSYFDGYPLGGISPLDLKAPLFVSAKLKQTPNGILIPDWRSIGQWWMSDIKSVKKAQTLWEEKQPIALWRGGFTKSLRKKLCEISLRHPDLLDARFSSEPLEMQARKSLEGLMGKRASWEEFLKCKYLPYVDGVMCAAPALQWRLFSRSLTLKPDSEEIQWFYRALRPLVHYLPVKSDLSDLIEKLEWAKGHDAESKQIGDQAYQFAKENLMYGDVLRYVSFVLMRYGSQQRLSRKELKREMGADLCWVNIHDRRSLRKAAQKGRLARFCSEATPPM